ncbi:MAG: ABC transporter permease [Gammaproteobacteria bacterium]
MFNEFIAFKTILSKEVKRFIRIWVQTLLPPIITMSLYFMIFGHLIGPRIGDMHGFPYMQYITPGLIMLPVINNAYGNVVGSFYGARFQRSVEELLVSPTSNFTILMGYVSGGILRGIIVALLVTLVASFFTHIHVYSYVVTISVVILSSTLFALAGFTNALFARNFDDITIIPTFVLTPLTYLGGVFYSIQLLPQWGQTLSIGNPILHMVNAFRYGFLGVADVSIAAAFAIIVAFIIILFSVNLMLLNKGIGIRT